MVHSHSVIDKSGKQLQLVNKIKRYINSDLLVKKCLWQIEHRYDKLHSFE